MTKEELQELKHNVFNPLAIIIGQTEVMKIEEAMYYERDIKIIRDQVKRIEEYIKSLETS